MKKRIVAKRVVPKKPPKRYRHDWSFQSHNDFRDGEYHVCTKCGAVKFR